MLRVVWDAQEEVDAQKTCIEQLDAQVSKTTNALALEQALATANQLQKTTVEERMAGLIEQIETMHRKWKEEQDARMQRQNEMYASADELRHARMQLIEANAATRCLSYSFLGSAEYVCGEAHVSELLLHSVWLEITSLLTQFKA
jgi:chromosome segregation ATPase